MFREISRQSNISGKLDAASIENILNTNIFGVFSCITSAGYPMTVPVHYVYYENSIYLHSANSGEKYDSIQLNQKVSFMISHKRDENEETPYTWYDTILAYGTASILDPSTSQEARNALKQLSLNCKMPQKATDRYIDAFVGKYIVIKISIDHLSGRFLHVH